MTGRSDSQSGHDRPRRRTSGASSAQGRLLGQTQQLRQPRLADMVAASLRGEILSGRLKEGDSLPPLEDLLAEFKVSPPAVREALRILETEGLISVRRGNLGGALVHLPTAKGVAYMVSLVLQVHQTPLDDVSAALRNLEPVCAAMCAARADRAEAVVPLLEEIVQQQLEDFEDTVLYNQGARRFHEAVVAHCGNETMILVVGALEKLWTAHEQRVYELGPEPSAAVRRSAVRAHQKLIAGIASGNADTATRIAGQHLDASQAFTMSTGREHRIVADLVRDRLG